MKSTISCQVSFVITYLHPALSPEMKKSRLKEGPQQKSQATNLPKLKVQGVNTMRLLENQHSDENHRVYEAVVHLEIQFNYYPDCLSHFYLCFNSRSVF